MRYTVTLAPDDNGTLLVAVPDLPEVHTFGEDRADALSRAVDAIETALMGRIAAREDIPPPSAAAGDFVDLPALSSLKVEIYRQMRTQDVGKAELARRLAVALPQIDRLLSLGHRSRLDVIERALAALGQQIDIRVRKAA